MIRFRPVLLALILSIVSLTTVARADATPDPADAFAQGYAAAILEREFGVRPGAVTVVGGVAMVDPSAVAGVEREKVVTAIAGVRGVRRVDFARATPAPVATTPGTNDLAQPRPATGDAADAGLTAAQYQGYRRDRAAAARAPRLLPIDDLFDPLLADPKWPHFSASYRYYSDDGGGAGDLRHVGAANFGESFSFYQANLPGDAGRWGLGLQAGLFAIFDLAADSKDLINADYFVGPTLSYRLNDLSLLGRVYHQSSHLGDEFLLEGRAPDRVNLSYEAVSLLASYDVSDVLRVYAGGAYIFHKEPADLRPWSVQYGVEYQSPMTLFKGRLRPVAAADFQHHEENDWSVDFSLRAGVQVEDPTYPSQKLQILLEYYDGHSPNGQFYDRDIRYFGVGIHLHL